MTNRGSSCLIAFRACQSCAMPCATQAVFYRYRHNRCLNATLMVDGGRGKRFLLGCLCYSFFVLYYYIFQILLYSAFSFWSLSRAPSLQLWILTGSTFVTFKGFIVLDAPSHPPTHTPRVPHHTRDCIIIQAEVCSSSALGTGEFHSSPATVGSALLMKK